MIRNTYGNLLKPARIGKMELKNRICMAPMDFKYFDGNTENSSMTHRQVKVFEERAKGGCGLIFTCATQAEQEIMPYPRDMQFPIVDRNERIKEFAEAADAVHVYGVIYVDRNDDGTGTMKRYKKESFNWYQEVIRTNGESIYK